MPTTQDKVTFISSVTTMAKNSDENGVNNVNNVDSNNGVGRTSSPRHACCEEQRRRVEALEEEKSRLAEELRRTEEESLLQEEGFTRRLGEAEKWHASRLGDMRNKLTCQKREGDKWKNDMMNLTNKFDTKVRGG